MKEGWEIVNIGSICNIITGKLDASASSENGIYPFFTCSRESLRIDNYAYDCECVLIAGNGDLNVKYYKGKFNAYQRTYIVTLKNDIKDVSVKYIFKFFEKYVEKLRQLSVGGVIKYIKLGDLTNAKIPVPPLEEQERIVGELDCLSGVIEKKKQQLKELDALAQSIFYEMFGNPVENDRGWEVKKFKDACEKIGDGLHGTPIYSEVGLIPFVNGTNLDNGSIRITDKTLYVDVEEAQKYHIEMSNSTILFSINGTLGRVALYKGENIILGKSVCYCNLKSLLMIKFVFTLMQTNAFKQFLEDNSSKSTIKNVGLKAIREFMMIIPPLSFQQEFAEKIESIEKQKELVRKSIEEVEMLFNSRMEYYFN
ncbi:MAG: restriction endonuclease subunit S [Paludibacteraceae bacterium]|nr:restriction endonuclease subunit S [Paludibacteraceae bacterium]